MTALLHVVQYLWKHQRLTNRSYKDIKEKLVMDALKRPLSVPPEFSVYAEEKGVFPLYQSILSQLVIHKPTDPLTFIAHYLSRPTQDRKFLIIIKPALFWGWVYGMLISI